VTDAAVQYVSMETYLAAERDVPTRHEYVGGVLYAMAGTSSDHNLVALALRDAVVGAGRTANCKTYVSDMKLKVNDLHVYYPDVMVVCDPQSMDPYTQVAPCLVAEVLSPSTRHVDLREKRSQYSSITTLRAYLIIDVDGRSVEVFRRGPLGRGWVSTAHRPGDMIELDCPKVEFQVDDLFADLG
jgi:Uma2 family endonuclease